MYLNNYANNNNSWPQFFCKILRLEIILRELYTNHPLSLNRLSKHLSMTLRAVYSRAYRSNVQIN